MAAVEFGAGYFGGIVGAVCCHPFDTLRTFQATNGLSWYATARKHVKTPSCVGSLYAGVASQCFTLGAYRSLTLGVTKSIMSRFEGKPTTWQLAGASGIAGAASAVIMGPSEIVKTRAMVDQSGGGSSFWAVAQREWRALRSCSARDLAGALRIVTVRDSLGNASFMVVYETLFQTLQKKLDRGSGSTLTAAMVAGGVAGPVGWTSIYPIEIYRIKAQTEKRLVMPNGSQEGVLARIQRFHGGKGFSFAGISQWFRGCPGCCLRSVVQLPVTMGAFEMCRSALTS